MDDYNYSNYIPKKSLGQRISTFLKEKLIWLILGFDIGILSIPITYVIDRRHPGKLPDKAVSYDVKGLILVIVIQLVIHSIA